MRRYDLGDGIWYPQFGEKYMFLADGQPHGLGTQRTIVRNKNESSDDFGLIAHFQLLKLS